ncbi:MULTISPECIES: hypothetical protein [Mixta]|uniref:hypothetical protein n=1 Tax=Mixta TaxID=2100764 RepID=UPI0023B8EC56|nr:MULTISPECIES: hypothetical protein [Mixta]MDU5769648.1 hypothetical protein [Mixta calida]MDU5826881.1 hypothetical protein [Mixta calida]
MKKTLFALSLLMTSNAFAEAIPQPILEVINVYQHGSFGLDKGVLSMAVKKPSVNEDMAVLFFQGICNTQYVGKTWNPDLVKKVVMFNASGEQQITINGGGQECKKLGPMNMDESDKYIKSLIQK